MGDVVSEADPLNRVTTHTYDTLGRLTSTTDPRSLTVSYGYDTVDHLAAVTSPGGTRTTTYDLAGQRTAMTDPSGSTTWTYDAAGRVTAVAAPQGTVSYTSNAAGQRTSMTLPGSRTVTYSYDPQGRMTTLTDWANRVISFGYNADGQRTTTTRPGGVTSTNTYDVAGRLTGVTHTGPGGTLTSFTSTLDAAGNRTGVTGPGGTETYTLDVLGRITSVAYPNGDTSTYTYDAGGNRLTWVRTGTSPGTTSYSYDNADQLITEGSVTYTYDAAGNVTARGGDSFTWDWSNRLTAATVGGTTTTYTYDGDDTRVRTTQGATTTNYLWDRQSGLPLLVDDGTTGYVHAGGLQEQVTGSTARALLTDGLGSVRGATDTAGMLVGSADYDVFGAVRGTSTTGSSFGFTGEQTDPETGFSFLRARSYDPGSGRFLSADTVQPNAPGTQGYNRYAYVANNPTTWTDPSGHLTAPQQAALTELTYAAKVTWACAQTVWCATFLGISALFLLTPEIHVQWAGFVITTAAMLVCGGFDIVREERVGPPGVFTRGGDHCFETYTQLNANIKDCAFRIADLCIPTPGGGPGDDCVRPGRVPLSVCVVPPTTPTPTPTPGEADTQCKEDWEPGPYKDVLDVRGTTPSRSFSDRNQRRLIFASNWAEHGYETDTNEEGDEIWVLRSDGDGRKMLWNATKGTATTRYNTDDTPTIDHICPIAKGGGSDNANACVLSYEENQKKRENPPYRCGRR